MSLRSIVLFALVLPSAALAQPRAPLDTALLAGVRWRNIGPTSSGRSVAVAGSAARPGEYYMGTTRGGVF